MARAGARRPDFVVIVAGDQAWNTLRAMPDVHRLLIDHGVRFTNAFVVNSLCCPSRTSILTGEYSHTTGIYTNGGAYGGFARFKDGSTIATWLHSAGYDTGLVGKYLNGYPGRYIPPGWDTWDALVMHPPIGNYYYGYPVSQGTTIRHYGSSPADYSTSVFANDAVRFIRRARGPMLLYFAPWAPHKPPIPPPGLQDTFANLSPYRPPNFNEADVSDKPAYIRRRPLLTSDEISMLDGERRRYYQAILGVDHAVKLIVEALRATGRLRNTMIVFTSDHGLSWGEHRWLNKQTPYEEDIRVPYVIRYPPLTVRPRTSSRMVLNIDLAPTIAELARAPIPPRVDGRSLVPILRRRATGWRTSFLIEHLHFASDLNVPTYCAVRTERRLFVVMGTGGREYYGLRSDPYELRNRAYDPRTASVRVALRRRLHQLCNPPPPGMPRP